MRRYGRRRRRRLNTRGILVCILTGLILVNASIITVRLLRGRQPEAADVAVPDYVQQELLPVNRWSRPGNVLKQIDGVVIHYVGNPGTTADANRNYFESLASGTEDTYASSHFVVGLEGEIIQCIPLTEVAYASKERNSDTVAVEVCHPDAGGEFAPDTYRSCVELTAWLCHTFELEPSEDVIRHYDVTGKLCPKYYVEHPESWEQFRADVTAEVAVLAAHEKK